MRLDWIEGRLNKSPLNSEERKQIADAYAFEFGREMRGACENCYHDALLEIYFKIRPMKTYILRAGVAFRFEGKIYTHLNLTDEAAIFYLKQSPEHAKHFIKFPKNWNKKQVRKDSEDGSMQ